MGPIKKTLAEMVIDPWFQSRPVSVKEKIMRYPPGLYRLKTTDQRVVIRSYGEGKDGSCQECTVMILREHNPGILYERSVFGIKFEDLEPIDTI